MTVRFKTLHNTAKSNDGKKLTKSQIPPKYCPQADIEAAKEKGGRDSSRLTVMADDNQEVI